MNKKGIFICLQLFFTLIFLSSELQGRNIKNALNDKISINLFGEVTNNELEGKIIYLWKWDEGIIIDSCMIINRSFYYENINENIELLSISFYHNGIFIELPVLIDKYDLSYKHDKYDSIFDIILEKRAKAIWRINIDSKRNQSFLNLESKIDFHYVNSLIENDTLRKTSYRDSMVYYLNQSFNFDFQFSSYMIYIFRFTIDGIIRDSGCLAPELQMLYDTTGNKLRELYSSRKKSNLFDAFSFKKGNKLLDLTAINNEEETVSTKNYRGQFLLVDFSASWCGACKMKNEILKSNYSKLKNLNSFEILTLSIDDFPAAWEQSVIRDNYPWPEGIWENKYSRIKWIDYYRISLLPTSFLVNKEGIIIDINPSLKNITNALNKD